LPCKYVSALRCESEISAFIRTDRQTGMARSTRLVILIKNICTLWGRKRFLLPVTYFPTNLVYPFTLRVMGINIEKRFMSKTVIPYILYFDDFEIINPLGGRTFPLCGCYISFPTFPSHFRSKVIFIFQIAFMSSAAIKKCGN